MLQLVAQPVVFFEVAGGFAGIAMPPISASAQGLAPAVCRGLADAPPVEDHAKVIVRSRARQIEASVLTVR